MRGWAWGGGEWNASYSPAVPSGFGQWQSVTTTESATLSRKWTVSIPRPRAAETTGCDHGQRQAKGPAVRGVKDVHALALLRLLRYLSPHQCRLSQK